MPYLLAAGSATFAYIIWVSLQIDMIRERYRERHQKLHLKYDRSIPNCRADVTFVDGSHSICFRLQVDNMTARKLRVCEGWLVSTDQFPNIGPVKLFWADMPGTFTVDLINGILRFLQICRITDSNQVIVATERENWPIDSIGVFRPGFFVFEIALKGDDNADTSVYSVRLNWTGNWTTSEMAVVK